MNQKIYLLFDAFVLGILGAFAARLFTLTLNISQGFFLKTLTGFSPPGLPSEGGNLFTSIGNLNWLLIILVTTFGGLLSGILIHHFVPEAEGLGTNRAIEAFHRKGGNVRFRVTPLKAIASAITIGTGGAAGREGTTMLLGAGIGSAYATFTKRTRKAKRILLLMGTAAGLSAIFRSPIGAAIFAIEVPFRDTEFETDALLYTLLAAIVAYVVNALMVGWQPLFESLTKLQIPHFTDYGWYALLGVGCGILGLILPNLFYESRKLFKKIPIPFYLTPAVGGLALGCLAIFLPQVLGGGYGWIQNAMNGNLAVSLMLFLIIGKMFAFVFTIASGGSGGVFAPALFIGAMLGGSFAKIFNQPEAPFVVVGMAGVIGSSARVPIAVIFMVAEMTEGYHLLIPSALSVIIAYFIQVQFSSKLKHATLYESQTKNKSDSPAYRIDNIRSALDILAERKPFDTSQIEDIDLMSLLESGIPLELPEGKQLMLASLKASSKCIGTKLNENCLLNNEADWEVISVVRDDHLFIPFKGMMLKQNDELLILTYSDQIEKIEEHIKPISIKNPDEI